MSGLGWNPEDEDRHAKAIRAVEVPLTVSAPADIPDTFDPSSWFRPENQGSLNSCCGNARAGLMEYLNWIETKHVEQFSRRFAYVTAKMVDAKAGFGRLSRDEGATINGGILASKEYGECLESLAPYWQPGERFTADLPTSAYEDAKKRRLKTSIPVAGYDDCDRLLTSGAGGLLLGIYWSAPLAGNRSAWIERWPGESGGGHALWLGGWKTRDGARWPGMWNSHGTGWGDNGHAWVAPEIVDRWCKSSPFKVIGASDLDTPHERPLPLEALPWT